MHNSVTHETFELHIELKVKKKIKLLIYLIVFTLLYFITFYEWRFIFYYYCSIYFYETLIYEYVQFATFMKDCAFTKSLGEMFKKSSSNFNC